MFEAIINTINGIAGSLAKTLPLSPFRPYLDMFGSLPYLGYLNWFIPVGTCVTIGASWLAVIGMFYLYSIVMRWIKMIGD